MTDTIIRIRASHAIALSALALVVWALTLAVAAKWSERRTIERVRATILRVSDAQRHQQALCLHTFMESNLRHTIDRDMMEAK